MAEHADTAEVESPAAKRFSTQSAAIWVGAVTLVILGAVAGWSWYHVHSSERASAERSLLIEAARQGVVNLTTIDYTTVDADIARILDSSTGAFHDDFQQRSKPFAEVVRQVKSTSEGTVTAAALASQQGDQAEVLLSVSMKMTNAGVAEAEARSWRMRVSVLKTGDVAKVSDVQFVT
jgi:Mce-associated membrane protein